MHKSIFAETISSTLSTDFSRVSDKILRLECSKDWPVSEAVQIFLDSNKDCRLFICRPFKKSDFDAKTITDDPKIATKWRNEKRRDFSILIVGMTGGPLDAGLKDVKKIGRRAIINEWRNAILKKLPIDTSELSKPEVKRLISELFDYVSSGTIQASLLEEYLECIFKTPQVQTICENLWILGLIPDSQAVDNGMAKRRLQRNVEVSVALKTSDDIKMIKKLQEV